MPYTDLFTWDGENLIPVAPRRADRHLVIGEKYLIETTEFRSDPTHKHQFAWLREAWASLPEQYALEPWSQSPEHLRKYALIRTGFCNCETFTCASKAEAFRWASNMRGMDEYAICQAQDTVVHRFTAKSQSYRAMGKAEFQASKTAILDFIAGLIGTDAKTLEQAA